jgi:predicted Fe-Mo cluster-binding NifX family protein
MKVAIPDWQGRISPVFDVAAHLLVAEVVDGHVRERLTVPLTTEDMQARVRQVAALGVNVLVCGVLSRPLECALANAGVEVVPRLCGDVECVLASYIAGQLGQGSFLMPGCCGRRRRAWNQHNRRHSP